MNIETVNELIASLESAGELSIREQKFLKLAKEFRICSASLDAAIKTGNVLADQNSQLAAENVGLNSFIVDACWIVDDGQYCDATDFMPETPATDRIVAGIKADGVEEFAAYQRAITEEWACKEGHSSLLKVAESAELFAKQLREGADK
ncbi:hypothetical protein LUX41_06630 [Klebsiella pneumoniae]|uniref:hypothetical protein n=1 Tax=Klebsiella pneumoniae TaxID=573 RepID=UPI00240E2046|nr:hypothetical protein [Klebsiella pneumoniae]WFA31438.1 hypothetical protein LUX41_06630 [Klebsiella pneumoniae]